MRRATKKAAEETPSVQSLLDRLGYASTVDRYSDSPITMKRRVKDLAKRFGFQVYRGLQNAKINLFPSHYYTSEPNVNELSAMREDWIKPSRLAGVDMNPADQMKTLKGICENYRAEYAENLSYFSGVQGGFGPGFGYVEAQCLHAMVRHFQPRRIIEVGSGVSTLCSLVASRLNPERCEITCIEPYPSTALLDLNWDKNSVHIRQEFVQQTPLDLFTQLEANDILFIDSSHVAKAGSDVVHLVLEVLPLLKPGVVVHIHDIYLPYEYQRDVLETFVHNNETPFVHAFLIFNSRFNVLASLSHLHYTHSQGMQDLFPGYTPEEGDEGLQIKGEEGGHFPSSLWLQVAGGKPRLRRR